MDVTGDICQWVQTFKFIWLTIYKAIRIYTSLFCRQLEIMCFLRFQPCCMQLITTSSSQCRCIDLSFSHFGIRRSIVWGFGFMRIAFFLHCALQRVYLSALLGWYYSVLSFFWSYIFNFTQYWKFILFQLYFNPATVKMLSNLKVLVIALLLKMVMKRRFSVIQVRFSYSDLFYAYWFSVLDIIIVTSYSRLNFVCFHNHTAQILLIFNFGSGKHLLCCW